MAERHPQIQLRRTPGQLMPVQERRPAAMNFKQRAAELLLQMAGRLMWKQEHPPKAIQLRPQAVEGLPEMAWNPVSPVWRR